MAGLAALDMCWAGHGLFWTWTGFPVAWNGNFASFEILKIKKFPKLQNFQNIFKIRNFFKISKFSKFSKIQKF
jgi:hypothetical protein